MDGSISPSCHCTIDLERYTAQRAPQSSAKGVVRLEIATGFNWLSNCGEFCTKGRWCTSPLGPTGSKVDTLFNSTVTFHHGCYEPALTSCGLLTYGLIVAKFGAERAIDHAHEETVVTYEPYVMQ